MIPRKDEGENRHGKNRPYHGRQNDLHESARPWEPTVDGYLNRVPNHPISIVVFQAGDGSFGAVPAEEIDGDEVQVLVEYDPFAIMAR